MSRQKIIDFFKDRSTEPSTWRGIVLIITALGVQLTPEQADAVVAIGLAVAGSVGVFSKDSRNA
jgi:hypothetical protein